MKTPVRVAVTGAAGQIGYSLLFRIASGAMLGDDQPVILQLLEITPALDALKGVAMELEDCAFPLLAGIEQTDDPNVAFGDVNYALLVGSRPRSKGMERKDLLEANGAIFTVQGKALSDNAAADVRILVVGNPANTNSLIAMNNAPNIDNGRFTAMTRLDHNRAIAQLAAKTGTTVNDITRMTIWGNHSATQYPDLFHAEVNGKNAAELIDDQAWIDGTFLPDRPAARRRHHRGPRPVERGVGRQRRHRPRAHLGVGHGRGRLGLDGHPERRQLRRARGPHVLVPGDHLGRRVLDRPGPRPRRLLPRQDRRLGRRAGRGARHRRRARPHLIRTTTHRASGPERDASAPVRVGTGSAVAAGAAT